ncbi:hypothetical protein BJY01DRAFT_244247 [Aspergillus pseudoustus]|uniref:Uncharacterized protein n=1 Tax=Aspergillus pseudoustus TaxID=1810923 RepID=A0ABR4KLY3_9EURO
MDTQGLSTIFPQGTYGYHHEDSSVWGDEMDVDEPSFESTSKASPEHLSAHQTSGRRRNVTEGQQRIPMPPHPRREDQPTARDRLLEFRSEGHGTISHDYCVATVRRVFMYRTYLLMQPGGHKIHHFNWRGGPVYQSSNTPPEVSLWFMTIDPKVHVKKHPRGFLWKELLLHNAQAWIDPVIVLSKTGGDLPQHPKTLLCFAKGRTKKLYTTHGSWRLDKNEGQTYCDTGHPKSYMNPKRRVGNGFIEGTSIRTRRNWGQYENLLIAVAHQDRVETETAAVKRGELSAVARRRDFMALRRSSPLSQSMTPADLEAEDVQMVSNELVLCPRASATPTAYTTPFGYDHAYDTFNLVTELSDTDGGWVSEPFQVSLYRQYLGPILEGDASLTTIFGDMNYASSARAFTDLTDGDNNDAPSDAMDIDSD